jgi:hypothetical protein
MARGVDLLLRHCAALDERPTARERLADALGGDLATMLVQALRPRRQRRGGRRSSSP